MNRPASLPRTARPRTSAPARRRPRQLLLPLPRPRSDQHRNRLPRMSQLAIDLAYRGRIIDLRREPDAATRLPRGLAGGRYRCCACAGALIFTGPATSGSSFTPRFRHDSARSGQDRCTAPAPHQADVLADLTAVLDLRDQLLLALPGADAHLHIDPAQVGQRWDLPPALILHRSEELVVIDHPRRPLTTADAARRLHAVRTRHGENVAHWWLFHHGDPAHFQLADLPHDCPGQPLPVHGRVYPTPAQRRITTAGGAVGWLAAGTVLLPSLAHAQRPGPAVDAAWWDLVPVPLPALGTPAASIRLLPSPATAAGPQSSAPESAGGNARITAPPLPSPGKDAAPAVGRPRTLHPTPIRRRFAWRRLLPLRWRR